MKLNSAYSTSHPVTSSVPQGSVLGPCFFILFVNDLCNIVKTSTIKLYADDVTIYHTVNNDSDYQRFVADLLAIEHWANMWQMKINIEKCKVLHFGKRNLCKCYFLNNIQIVNSSCEKILGVYVDTECKFKQHIFGIVKKARKTCGIILKAFQGSSIEVMISLYNTYVRCLLEYANVVFCPHHVYLSNLLENVQRFYTKRLPGLWYTDYNTRLIICKLDSLECRRNRADLLMVYKILHNECHSCIKDFLIIQNSITRGHSMKLFKVHSRLDVRKYFFVNRVVDNWNLLDNSVVSCTNVKYFMNSISY